MIGKRDNWLYDCDRLDFMTSASNQQQTSTTFPFPMIATYIENDHVIDPHVSNNDFVITRTQNSACSISL